MAFSPTNHEILATATRNSWLTILFLWNTRKISLRYSYVLSTTVTPHPLSLSGYTFFELVFITSDAFSIWALLILLWIMTETSLNGSDADTRPINLYHHVCMRLIFLVNWMLSLGRWTAVFLEYEMFMWRPIISLFLQILIEVGYDRLKRIALEWLRKIRGLSSKKKRKSSR